MKPFSLFSAGKSPHGATASGVPDSYWTLTADQLFAALDTTGNGIQPTDAAGRLKTYGLNALKEQQKNTVVGLLLSQFRSPLVLILIFVTILLHKPIGYVSSQAEQGYQPASVLIRPDTRWSEDRAPLSFKRSHLADWRPPAASTSTPPGSSCSRRTAASRDD